jgi:hypothetical protein
VPAAQPVNFDGDLSPDSLRLSCVKHSPFLAHTAVASLLSKPSTMYNAFTGVLDFGDLVAVQTRITEARKRFEKVATDFASSTTDLRSQLHAIEDPRAIAATAALASEPQDLQALEALATGTEQPGTELDSLRRLAALPVPNTSAARDAIRQLAAAHEALSGESPTNAAALDRIADLLERAVVFRSHDSADGVCPVCQTPSVLDAEWESSASTRIADLRAQTGRLGAARNAVESATRSLADALIQLAPQIPTEEPKGVDLGPLRAAITKVDTLRQQPSDLNRLQNDLPLVCDELVEAHKQVVEAAIKELAESDNAWRTVAAPLAAWCTTAKESIHSKARVSDLKKAETWTKVVLDEVRNDRFRPIADEAQRLWQMMRTESNVDLKTITLGRKLQGLELGAGADGVDAEALAVMSQGELNTLVLSLFLPRATLDSSPFRFVMVDDPVQAMDPSKVEGLAQVLHDLGKTRQVVVFTHDERLPAAIEALSLAATVMRVVRGSNSVVSVVDISNPSDRFVNDAGAVCADDNIPAAIKHAVSTALCRDGVEAAASRAYRRISARKRRAIADVEATIATSEGPYAKLALALFDDASRTSEVLARLAKDRSKFGHDAPAAVKALKEVHVTASASLTPQVLVSGTRALCRGLDIL